MGNHEPEEQEEPEESEEPIDFEELQHQTELYHQQGWEPEQFIMDLFGDQYRWLRATPCALVNATNSDWDVLVILVGYTWDPLLITICAHNPTTIVPVLNEEYVDTNWNIKRDNLVDYLNLINNHYHQFNILPVIPNIYPDPVTPVEDTPVAVFKFLKDKVLPLKQDNQNIIIDITGAKKSITAGAYLFAAFADITISYLDFEDYDIQYGRPFGWSGNIKHFDNPLEKFKILEWNKVRPYYESNSFEMAKNSIGEVIDAANDDELFSREEIQTLTKLSHILEILKLWYEENNKPALTLAAVFSITSPKRISQILPHAIIALGDYWFDPNNPLEAFNGIAQAGHLEASIYANENIDKLLHYAVNELEICNIIYEKGDYRSALLRTAGLFELLFKARVINLWINGRYIFQEEGHHGENRNQIRARLVNEHGQNNGNEIFIDLERELILNSNTTYLSKSLQWTANNPHFNLLRITVNNTHYEGHRGNNANKLHPFWVFDHTAQNLQDLYNFGFYPHGFIRFFRNNAIHFCLNIPSEVANLALRVTGRNLQDFMANWVEIEGLDINNLIIRPPQWEEIINFLNLNFLP